MTGPTFIQEAETAYSNAVPKSTASFSVEAGDVLVAYSMGENALVQLGISGGSLTWNEVVSELGGGGTGQVELRMWTAIVDSNKSMTVSFTNTGSALVYGGNVLTFRGSDGIGATNSTNNGTGSGAPSLNITTSSSTSAVVVANADWNAVNGSSRTWRTNAGTLTEQTYDRDAATHTFYGGYHADAGTAGTYAVGLSAPSGQRYAIGAVEVLGTNPASNPPSAPQTLTSSSSAGSVNLDWSAPADAGTSNMLTYEIYRHTSTFTATPTATFVASIATTSTAYSDTGATHGTNYYYGVTATNSEGEGALSNLVFTSPNSGRVIRLGGYFSS